MTEMNVIVNLTQYDLRRNKAGLHHGDCLEKVHLDFCKRSLGVKKSSCNVMIYAALGRLPLQAVRKYKIIKYWAKLLSTDNIILKQCY